MSVDTISVTLAGPGGTYHPTEVSFTASMNAEIQWSAKLAQAIPMTWADTAPWTITVSSKAGAFATWTSPQLVALDPQAETRDGVGPMTINGKDLASHLLSAEGQTLATFTDTLADDVITYICGVAGTSVSYLSGTVLHAMRLPEYDVQGSTENYGSHISRICRDAGYNWRPCLAGGIEVLPINYDTSLGTVVVGSTQRRKRMGGQYTQIVCRKTSKIQGSYTFTADTAGMQGGDLGAGFYGPSISITDLSTSGSVGYVAAYEGPSGGGNLVWVMTINPQYPHSLTPTLPSGTARSVVWSMHPPTGGGTTVAGKLVVSGRPPGSYTYDLAFTSKHPTTDSALRKRILLVESPLWPTQAWLENNYVHVGMLAEANKATDTIRRSVKFNPWLWPGGTLAADSDAPKARYDSVSWSVGRDVSMEISGFAWPF